MVYIKLTKDGQSWYLDCHFELSTKELAWVFDEEEALDITTTLRSRGSYHEYVIEVE